MSPRRISLTFGVLFLITFITAIGALIAHDFEQSPGREPALGPLSVDVMDLKPGAVEGVDRKLRWDDRAELIDRHGPVQKGQVLPCLPHHPSRPRQGPRPAADDRGRSALTCDDGACSPADHERLDAVRRASPADRRRSSQPITSAASASPLKARSYG